MTFKKLFAASVCMALTVGMVASAFAQTTTTTTTTDPNYRGTVNVDIIDNNNEVFIDRIQTELVERPAPQVGQTRGAIEALYGPAQHALAPGKEFEMYTNEMDLTDGKMFRRHLTQEALRVYEVSYNTGANKTPNDKAVDVKLRVIPRIGDHKALVSKIMGAPINSWNEQGGQRVVYGIPKHRYVFYNDVLHSPWEAVNTYYNAEGFMVGQEFMPANQPGQHVLTSAGRYVEFESKHQPDVKVLWGSGY